MKVLIELYLGTSGFHVIQRYSESNDRYALGADPKIKELMKDEVLVQIAKELVEIINENLTLDAFKREDARARIRVNIRRLFIKYSYLLVKREGAVEKVIRQAELKYQEV